MKKIFKDLLFVIIALVIFYTFIQSDYSLTNNIILLLYYKFIFFNFRNNFYFFSVETKLKLL